MRLIDGDELLKPVGSYERVKYTYEYGDVVTVEDIELMPTIEAEPIRHGKWEHGREVSREYVGRELVAINYEDYHCSVCGAKYKNKDTIITFKFCPICGTHMEGVEE